MAHIKSNDDDRKWNEVRFINSYAVLVGHLSLGVRGLSILILTWTTVVLLGGFISALDSKDFWCLTLISLVQTAGVFDVLVKEKLSNVWRACLGLFSTMLVSTEKRTVELFQRPTFSVVRMALPMRISSRLRIWYSLLSGLRRVTSELFRVGMAAVQALVFAIVSLPLAALYTFGLYISAGLSVWRLKQRDYDIAHGDTSKGNLMPALLVLYSLALFQGLLFGYKNIMAAYAEKKITGAVAWGYGLRGDESGLVSDYLADTRTGCEMNPRFAGGRNLITHAVELLESKSPDSYIAGVRTLGALVRLHVGLKPPIEPLRRDILLEQHRLMKQLLLGSGCTIVIQRLLHTLDSRAPYERKTRECAAAIVALLAGDVRLEQFPGGIQCIASLLGTFEEYSSIHPYQRGWLLEAYDCEPDCLLETYSQVWPSSETVSGSDGHSLRRSYKNLVLQGMRILSKLAASHDNNCKIIISTPVLLSKIMAPLTADILHTGDHSEWPSDVVEGSLRVMLQLIVAASGADDDPRHAISSNRPAISGLLSILRCDRCGSAGRYYILAVKILTQLSLDGSSSSLDTESRHDFIKTQLHVLGTRMFVSKIVSYETFESVGKSAGEALALLSANESNAAAIFEADQDGVLDNLIIVLLNVDRMTYRTIAAEILENLFRHYNEEDQFLTKLKEAMIDAMPKILTEILLPPGSPPPQNRRQHNSQMYGKLQAALLSLCATACDALISEDQDLVRTIAPGDDAPSFAAKLRMMVERNSDRTASCLGILKVTSKMVISMLKHRGSYTQQDLQSLVESLSTASRKLSDLDFIMVFDSTTMPVRTLASLVKEAQELVEKKKEEKSP